jgi:hypothetical protein
MHPAVDAQGFESLGFPFFDYAAVVSGRLAYLMIMSTRVRRSIGFVA